MKNAQLRLFQTIHEIIDHVASKNDLTHREVAEKTAFHILVALDGESLGCPPFKVQPLGENGEVGNDIAGNLHENFRKIKRLPNNPNHRNQ